MTFSRSSSAWAQHLRIPLCTCKETAGIAHGCPGCSLSSGTTDVCLNPRCCSSCLNSNSHESCSAAWSDKHPSLRSGVGSEEQTLSTSGTKTWQMMEGSHLQGPAEAVREKKPHFPAISASSKKQALNGFESQQQSSTLE